MYGMRSLLLTAAIAVAIAMASASAISAVAAPTPAADAQPEKGGLEGEECAPPCGYIWPRIGVETDIPNPYAMSKVEDFPTTTEVAITYSWDIEQEGTGVPEPGEDMKILIVVTRTPAFLTASLDRNVCEFTIIPVVSEYEVCTLTLSVSLDLDALPETEEQLREEGHRLMLFAASEESGTFMRSYGLEDIRFRFEQDPEANVDGGDVEESPLPVAGLLVVGLGGLGGLAALRRRR